MPDGEENGSLDVNFLSIELLLSKQLESLQSILLQSETEEKENRDSMVANAQDYREKHISQMNKSRIQSESTTINTIIESLRQSRTDVSSQSREMLLAQLYKLIVIRPLGVFNDENAGTPNYVSEEKVLDLVHLFSIRDYRSPSEFILLFRCVVSILASDLEDFGEIASRDFFASVSLLLIEPPTAFVTNQNKADVITGYTALLLVVHHDSSSFGIDEKIKWFLEYAQGYVQSAITLTTQLNTGDREYSTLMNEGEDKKLVSEQESNVNAEANLAISAIHAMATLMTLLNRGSYLNELITSIASELVEIIDNDVNIEIAKAGARALALCYELYSYEGGDVDPEDVDEEFNYDSPYYEQESLLSICNRLSNISSKKVGRKDKKDTHTVFSQLANTINNYTNAELREELYKKSLKGHELSSESVSTTTVKLSRSKILNINSWFLYFRLLTLKWCFGFGLHDQLVHNEDVRSILREPPTAYQEKYGYTDEYDGEGQEYGLNARTDAERFAKAEKKRDADIKKARVKKLTTELEDLGIKED